jgi:hypothetical protein
MNTLNNGWYLVAFAYHSLKNSMVAGILGSGTYFEMSLLFENWMVAGSCCSSKGYKYKNALKIGW